VGPFLLWRQWIQQFPEGIPAWDWLLWGKIKPFQPAWWRWLFYERIGNLILGGWGVVFLVLGVLCHFERPAPDTRREKFGWGSDVISRIREALTGNLLRFLHILGFSHGIASSPARNDNIYYFTWLASTFLYLVIFASGNVQHDYYQIILIPVICVFVGRGIVYIWDSRDFNKNISLPTLFFVILASLMFSWYQIRGYYQINNPAILEAGQAVDDLLPEDAKVIAPYFGDTSFLYQTNRKGWPLVTHYPIEEMIRRGATHYVSVTYDEYTKELMERFEVLKTTDKYVIIKLT